MMIGGYFFCKYSHLSRKLQIFVASCNFFQHFMKNTRSLLSNQNEMLILRM